MSAFSVFYGLRTRFARRVLARAQRLAAAGHHRQAFPLLVHVAYMGLADAALQVGRCYLQGLGVPPHAGHATKWLQRAAAAGNAAAHVQLAEFALQGIASQPTGDLFARYNPSGTGPDWVTAKRHAGQAAQAGSAEAQALQAFILSDGPEDCRDLSRAEALYRLAADGGSSRAQLGLAILLLRMGNPAHTDEARSLLQIAAQAGIITAHYMLGIMAESDADHAAAVAFYCHAAEAGHLPAQTRYAVALLNGRGIAQDAFAAETWLRRAALGGDTQAASLLGALYAQGEVLAPNPAEARIWLEQAADCGHNGAARTLAYMLLGQSRVPERPRAEALLRQAAAAGDETAALDLQRLAVSPAPA